MVSQKKSEVSGLEVAVVGMAGRFPGALNIKVFWENLKNGVESITTFSDTELEAAGVARELFTSPNYVKAKGILDQAEYFDASFFGYSPKDAQMLDPQVRVFYECVWEALEDAGYDPYRYQGLIGLYAGASTNLYWEAAALTAPSGAVNGGASNNPDSSEQFSRTQLMDKGFLPTRISYNLNLKGPSIFVYTACSTSLMAVHVACRALLTGECQIALAGGVTLSLPQRSGYLYQEGMITSPDGHCRAFDARAGGTVWGEGAGVVVLKMLKNALADGDHIYAVVKGTAVNNDGLRKVGYTAPSIEGQADVIRAAQRMARVEPESVSYIEAHGTGTVLGDPIEIEALRIAFRTDKKQFCRIGSVKTNIGHLDSAAGIAGFIKTVLALYHRQIPPSLHYETPNPKIDFANSPFMVNTQLTDWTHDSYPLRAGVSAFGIGGTNAHVVLEQAPPVPLGPNAGAMHESPLRESPPPQFIPISAKTKTALAKIGANLAGYLQENPGTDLADFAYTLSVGRAHFPYRRTVVCHDVSGAIEQLLQPSEPTLAAETDPDLTFMFPGQGSQYPNMGRELYETEAVFREELNRCSEILKPILNLDLIAALYPDKDQDADGRRIYETALTQPVIFSVEYALAALLMKWGLKPRRMIGHSIGEYVAACLAGVFSLEDALTLVAMRGKLMQEMAEGAMLSVPLSEAELTPWLGPDLSLAAVNGPSLCVVSGPKPAIQALEEQLRQKRIDSIRLQVSHAFHSSMMEPVLSRFLEQVKGVRLSPPKIPYVSNVTGTWITDEEATNPDYWVRHLRNPVRFSEGISKLLETGQTVLVETGGGRTLRGLVESHPGYQRQTHFAVNVMRHPKEAGSDLRQLLSTIAQLWRYGISPDWSAFYGGQSRRRISLPVYPFERQRFWLDGNLEVFRGRLNAQPGEAASKRALDEWFYIPAWKRAELPDEIWETSPADARPRYVLMFMNDGEFSVRLVEALRQTGVKPVLVKAGATFRQEKEGYLIRPGLAEDYQNLFRALRKSGIIPSRIIHSWMLDLPLTGKLLGKLPEKLPEKLLDFSRIEAATDLGFYSLIHIAQWVGELKFAGEMFLDVLTNDLQPVTGRETLAPEKALILGPVKIIPQEDPRLKVRSIDIEIPGPGSGRTEPFLKNLLKELAARPGEPVVAWRGNERWIPSFEPVKLKMPQERPLRLRQNGVYLITGGLGGVGLAIAGYLAQNFQAKLVLTGRSHLPPRTEWGQWLVEHHTKDRVSRKIWKVKELEEMGGTVITVNADIADIGEMRKALNNVMSQFGKVDGVIHCAGMADGGMIQLRNRAATDPVLAPKVKGTVVLDELFRDLPLDFILICSSLSSIIPTFGQVGYTAANSFLDAYAHYKTRRDGTFTVAVNWDAWREVGMMAAAPSAAWANETLATGEGDSKLRTAWANETLAMGEGDSKHRAAWANETLAMGEGDSKHRAAWANETLATGEGDSKHRAAWANETLAMGEGTTERIANSVNTKALTAVSKDSTSAGSTAGAGKILSPEDNSGHGAMLEAGILTAEGIEVVRRILNLDSPCFSQIIVSTGSLEERYRQWSSLDLRTIQAGLQDQAHSSSRFARPDLPNPYIAPRNEIEAKLAEIWQEILGIEKVGIDDSFFDLGGHSLKAASLNSSLYQTFQLEVPLRQIFITPTIAGLAEFIAAGTGNGALGLAPENPPGTVRESGAPQPEMKLQAAMPPAKEGKKGILIDFQNLQKKYPQGKMIHRFFEEQAERTPDKIAVIFETTQITYRELNHRANQLARFLREKGIGPDEITGVMAERSPEILIGMLGILKAGGAYLPVDPELLEDKIRYMLEDSNPRILLTQRRLLSEVKFRGELINLDNDSLYQGDGTNPEKLNTSSNIAYVIYTPGSTGKLNRIMIEHQAVSHIIHGMSEMIPFGSRKTSLCLTGMSSDRFFMESFLPLANGLRIVMASEYQQKTLWLINTLIIDYQVEIMQVTPARLEQLASDPDFGISCMPFLREIILDGATCPDCLLQMEKPAQTRIYYVYGSPETMPWLSLKEIVPGTPESGADSGPIAAEPAKVRQDESKRGRVFDKRLTQNYYYLESGQVDQFVTKLDCSQALLYFVLKNKTGLEDPYELFTRDFSLYLSENKDGGIVEFDFLDYTFYTKALRFNNFSGKGFKTLARVEALLDRGEMVVLQTFSERLPFFSRYIGFDAPEDLMLLGHMFLAVWHDEDHLYYVESPWDMNHANFIPYAYNKSVGIIPKKELEPAFKVIANYKTVTVKKGALPDPRKAMKNIKRVIARIKTNYYKKAEQKGDLNVYYGRGTLEKLIEICGRESKRLNEAAMYGRMDIHGVLLWRFWSVVFRLRLLNLALHKFEAQWERVNFKRIFEVLETAIKAWEHTIFYIEDQYSKRRYLMDLDLQKYFIRVANIEEELLNLLFKL